MNHNNSPSTAIKVGNLIQHKKELIIAVVTKIIDKNHPAEDRLSKSILDVTSFQFIIEIAVIHKNELENEFSVYCDIDYLTPLEFDVYFNVIS